MGAPAIVVVADADPLRDEGIAYAALLNRNGRGAALWDVPDTVHGFAAYPHLFPQAHTDLELLADALKGLCSTGIAGLSAESHRWPARSPDLQGR
jgi:acetyl esterase